MISWRGAGVPVGLPAAPSRVAMPPRRKNGSRLPRLYAPCYYFCKCTQKKRFVCPLRAKNATLPRFYAFPHRLLRASTPCAGIRTAGLYALRPLTLRPLSQSHPVPLSSSRVLFSKPSRLPFLPSAHSFPSHRPRFPKPSLPFLLPHSKLLPPLCPAPARYSLPPLRARRMARQYKR